MSGAYPVVIVGGGWAGLAAAVELTSQGVPVAVLESARQLGGRARCAPFRGRPVDNGQHLLIGAYSEFLRLLGVMGLAEGEVLKRMPLHLRVETGTDALELRAPTGAWPAPQLWALLGAKGLGWRERLGALKMGISLRLSHFSLREDMSVSALLQRHGQGPRIRALLWEPLCLAALNTPASEASARAFLRVFRDAFATGAAAGDLLLPRVNLGRLFPLPAMDYIERHRGMVRVAQRVNRLTMAHGRVTGVVATDEPLRAKHVILATPVSATRRLLESHGATRSAAETLAGLTDAPITTVYLQYPQAVSLRAEMLGADGMLAQWIFDRSFCGQPGVIAAVISGHGEHMALTQEELVARVTAELADRFPHWPAPSDGLAIRDKRATFHCDVDVDARRPGNDIAVPGLWLAGDYTDTGYPATLEGAVRSGVEAARRVLEAGA